MFVAPFNDAEATAVRRESHFEKRRDGHRFIVSQTRRMALKMTGPRHVPHRMHTSRPISVRLFPIPCSKDFAVKIHFCFKGGILELFQT